MKLTTAQLMRELDSLTINGFGVPGVVLMENAGRSTVQVILSLFGAMAGKRVCVFAGRGNNGGDGFVVARYLFKEGCDITVYLLSSMDMIAGDAKINMDACGKLGVPITEVEDEAELKVLRGEIEHADLIIDALLGTGLNSEVRGLFAAAIRIINGVGAPVLAIDIPSGLDSDRGVPLGACVRADVTVTYGLPKTGQLLYPGRSYAGSLYCADIGVPAEAVQSLSPLHTLLEPSELILPEERRPDSHKGHAGRLLIVAGSPGMTGAAAMASETAARTGAGLVTLAVPESLNPILEVKITEAMTAPVPDDNGLFGQQSLDALLELLDQKTALALGPGLSHSDGPALVVRELIANARVPMVIDADGLNILAQDISVLREAKAPVVITPHPGEMARLTDMSPAEVQNDRIGVAIKLASDYNIIVVLKGAGTVIALPDRRACVNTTGNPGMATGGMGDILTGLIGGLLAQNMDPAEAAKTGVYIHGLAADRCALEFASVGYLASDLIPFIPPLLDELRLNGEEEEPEIPLIKKIY